MNPSSTVTDTQGFYVQIFIEVDQASSTEFASAAVNLSAIYATYKIIDEIIKKVLGDGRDDQRVESIESGSPRVSLLCFTDERVLEVFKDFKSGRMRQRLYKEFSDNGIKTHGLVVTIENIKEVEEKAEKIKKCRRLKKKKSKDDEAVDSLSLSISSTNLDCIPQIIVQGGAYHQKPRHMCANISEVNYVKIIKKAAKRGYAHLKHGGSAVDAVEAAVRVLEDSKFFNAGYGSLLNNDREVECDAMIMDGHTIQSGAVMSGRYFKNPVSLAKLIMNDTQHCALSGEGALNYALEKRFPVCFPKALVSTRATKLNVTYPEFPGYVRNRFKGVPCDDQSDVELDWSIDYDGDDEGNSESDTVSAVARDKNGFLASASSTGGVAGRLKGRVSDASMVGCGSYANEQGAATASGLGESIIRMTLAREVVYNMEGGQNAQDSAKKAVENMGRKLEDVCGVIAIDKDGNFGKAFSTAMMGWASIKGDTMLSGLRQEEEISEPLDS